MHLHNRVDDWDARTGSNETTDAAAQTGRRSILRRLICNCTDPIVLDKRWVDGIGGRTWPFRSGFLILLTNDGQEAADRLTGSGTVYWTRQEPQAGGCRRFAGRSELMHENAPEEPT